MFRYSKNILFNRIFDLIYINKIKIKIQYTLLQK